MGHFRKSSYAYLLYKYRTILTAITSTTTIHKGNTITAIVDAKKNIYIIFACYIQGEGISAPRMAGDLIVGSKWGRIQFLFHWCTLQVGCPHQFRTLTVERSPQRALVTKLAF